LRAASAHQARELLAQRGEVLETVFDHGEFPLGELARRGTAPAVVELKQRGHLVQREAESLRALYEPQPRETLIGVAENRPVSAPGKRQQSPAVVPVVEYDPRVTTLERLMKSTANAGYPSAVKSGN